MNAVPTPFWNWADSYYKENIDLVDIEALYDRAITVSENITLFKQNCPNSDYALSPNKRPQSEPQQQPGIHSVGSSNSIVRLLSKPRIIGVVADVNQGKSMLLYHVIEQLKKEYSFNLYYYGLRESIPGAVRVYSLREIENITNSVIIVDELPSLIDFDDRKERKSTEASFRLINHNNNVVILAGVPENYKKFVAAKLDAIIFKKTTIADCINGSAVKERLMEYRGNERGSKVLSLQVNEALLYDGEHYSKLTVPYYPQYDTKAANQSILQNVQENVQIMRKLERVE